SWVNVVYAHMPEGTHFVRLGRSGITLREANAVELPQAVAAQPDVVTLWNCVNDVAQGVQLDSYLQDLKTTLTRLTTETKAKVVLLNLPDITVPMDGRVDPTQRSLIQGGVRHWNSAMGSAAAAYGGRI